MKRFYRWSTLWMVCAMPLLAVDRYVDRGNATPLPPYTNGWGSAANDIQTAVDAAGAGDTVWIAPGRYTLPPAPVVDEGTNVVFINKPLTLRASGPAAETVVDGEGAYRGILVKYLESTPQLYRLDGLTVTNGHAADRGGGILFNSQTFYCTGGVYNCIIEGNVAETNGGGIVSYNQWATPTHGFAITNCVIRNNRAVWGHGAGLYRYASGPCMIRDSRIEFNRADNASGTNQLGGGIFNYRGSLWIENCVLFGNVGRSGTIVGGANIGGGALYRQMDGTVVLRNCLVANNTGYRGAAIHVQQAPNIQLDLNNCTIVSNTGSEGPINFRGSSGPGCLFRACNTIIHSNAALNLAFTLGNVMEGTVAFTNCCTPVDAKVVGSGNLTDGPAFQDFAAADYRLSSGSPCLNAGFNQSWMDGAVDLDGHARKDRVSGVVDIGCYEYVYRGSMVTIR